MIKLSKCLLLFSIFSILGCSNPVVNGDKVEIYVSSNGLDTNLGTKNSPLATIEVAKKLLVKIGKSADFKSAKILVADGVYFMDKTVVFDDSLKLPHGVSISIEGEGDNVLFHGGKRFDASVLKEVKSQEILKLLPPEKHEGILYSVDIKECGLENCGEFINRGFKEENATQMELFIDSVPQTISRYPNGIGLLEIGDIVYSDVRDPSELAALMKKS